MFAKVFSGAVYGVDAYEVEIEVSAAGGNPVIVVVGLPDTAVKESKDRVTTAVGNSGYFWPRGRTTEEAEGNRAAGGRASGSTSRRRM
jgi:magnesium chelatase family protein